MLDDMIGDYDEDTINLLRYQLTTSYIDKDKVLCNEGDDLAAAFYVVGGQVTLTMTTASRRDGRCERKPERRRWWRVWVPARTWGTSCSATATR